MKPYVDIEGSGINVTNITGNGNNLEGPVLAGVVAGADQTGLRNLTVTHLGGAGLSFAIAVTLQGGEMRMTDLVAKVEDAGQSFSSGIVIADTKGIIVVEDVRAITPMFQSMAIAVSPIASNESVEIVLFNNVLAQSPSAAMGLFQTGAIVRNSILDGGAIGSERFFGTAKVISTGIFGTADGDSLLCIGAYDFDLQPLDATCQGSSVATLSTEPPVTNPFTTAQ